MIETDETAEAEGRIEGVRLVRDEAKAGEASEESPMDGEPDLKKYDMASQLNLTATCAALKPFGYPSGRPKCNG